MSDHSSALPVRTTIPAAWVRGMAWTGLGFLLGTAVLVAWRRASGALTCPLTPSRLVAAVVLIVLLALGVRALWQTVDHRSRSAMPMLLASIAVVVLVLGLCLPGTTPLGLLAVGIVLIAEELWAWRKWYQGKLEASPSLKAICLDGAKELGGEGCAAETAATEIDEELPSEAVLQQLTRSCSADGNEEIAGFLRMTFSPGQRTGNLHVAFCPPFPSTPELLVEQVDGPEVRVKLAQVLPYGARLDLKLAIAANEPTSVLLQFAARAATEK